MTIRRLHPLAGVLASLALVTASGCATKGFVRTEMEQARAYTDTRVGEVRTDLDQVKTQVNEMNELTQRLANGTLEYTEVSNGEVRFAFDDWRLSPESQATLDGIAAQLATHPRYALEVRGFADATGPDRYNYRLGRERADEVVRYLTSRHQVPSGRIATLSFGEENPVATNDDSEGRAMNRRAQVRLLNVAPGQLTTSPSAGRVID